MNILIVSSQWTTEPKGGGVQSSVCTLVDALSRSHSVTVFVPRWRRRKLDQGYVGKVGIYRRRMRFPEGSRFLAAKSFLAWLIELPATLRDLRRIFHEGRIDVVHLHQLQANQVAFAVARILGGPPYVATFHGRDVRDYRSRSWIERLVIRQIVRLASGFTAVSQELAALAQQEIPGVTRVQVIRNGMGTEDTPTHSGIPDGMPAKYFLAVGRLYPLDEFPLKGQDLLIRAWCRLRQTNPDLHLLLAGADDERPGYEELARRCDVDEQVHILGSIPRQQLLTVMAGAMGVVTASRSEGGGPTMTILEAASLARPLVASNIPAHSECLQDGVDCLLVPLENPESIAGAVVRLIDNPAFAAGLGHALQKKMRMLSSADQMSHNYVQLAYSPASEAKRFRRVVG